MRSSQSRTAGKRREKEEEDCQRQNLPRTGLGQLLILLYSITANRFTDLEMHIHTRDEPSSAKTPRMHRGTCLNSLSDSRKNIDIFLLCGKIGSSALSLHSLLNLDSQIMLRTRIDKAKETKTFSKRGSLLVTDATTNRSTFSLSTAERTGSPSF